MKTLYQILGVRKNAKPETIKKAYRKLSQKHHPDKGGDEEMFKSISEAWSILKDKNKREHYDRTGEVPDKACNINSQAAVAIIEIFNQWLASVQQKMTSPANNWRYGCEDFKDLINVDLVTVIKDSLGKSLINGLNAKKELNNHIDRMELLKARCEGGFAAVVQDKINNSHDKIKTDIQPQIEQIKAAQEMIEDGSWTYVFDKPEEPVEVSHMITGTISLEHRIPDGWLPSDGGPS